VSRRVPGREVRGYVEMKEIVPIKEADSRARNKTMESGERRGVMLLQGKVQGGREVVGASPTNSEGGRADTKDEVQFEWVKLSNVPLTAGNKLRRGKCHQKGRGTFSSVKRKRGSALRRW